MLIYRSTPSGTDPVTVKREPGPNPLANKYSLSSFNSMSLQNKLFSLC